MEMLILFHVFYLEVYKGANIEKVDVVTGVVTESNLRRWQRILQSERNSLKVVK